MDSLEALGNFLRTLAYEVENAGGVKELKAKADFYDAVMDALHKHNTIFFSTGQGFVNVEVIGHDKQSGWADFSRAEEAASAVRAAVADLEK